MAAKCKVDLQMVFSKELHTLKAAIDALDAQRAMIKVDDVSIKDIVAHRAHWIDLFLGWYADGQTGKQVDFPAPGYKWNALKRYNADLRAQQADLGWDDAKAMLDRNAQRLATFIESNTDATLYGRPMQGAHNQWTAGRWAEAAGPSHFRSATKYIRKAIKGNF